MGRGNSFGGGQSSLGYLFGSGETLPNNVQTAPTKRQEAESAPSQNIAPVPPPVVSAGQAPMGNVGSQANNYFRAEGQNCGNFITDRPSTKVHAAPGGGSSLDYLFGSGSTSK